MTLKLTDETVINALNGNVQNPILHLFDILQSDINSYRANMPDYSIPTNRYKYREDKFGFLPKQIDNLDEAFNLSALDIISIYARILKEGLYHPEFSSVFKSAGLKFASQNLQSKHWNGIAQYMHTNLFLPDEVKYDESEFQKFKSKIEEINGNRNLIRGYDPKQLSDEYKKYMYNLSHIICQTSFESML